MPKLKFDKDKIINEIIELRIKKGYSSTSLVKYLEETHKVKVARAYELIRESREKMGEVYNKVNDKILEESIIFLEQMRQDALNTKNNRLALEIQKELNKVNNLYIKKLDITTNGESINIKDLLKFKDDRTK
jgi:hypothetical protein